MEFNIPSSLLGTENEKGEILFVCRLQIQGGEYYPFSADSKIRYLGAKFTTYSKVHELKEGYLQPPKLVSNTIHRSNIRIDTLENLITNKAWKKKNN